MWSFRFKVMRNLIIVTVIAVTIVMLMPLTYRSTAIIMPPKSESGLNISSALSSLPFGNILGTGGDSKALTFLAILKSRKIQLAIIKKFNLENIYNTKFIEDAIEELNNNTSIEIEEEGTIKISFTAKTPWFHREHEITQRKELVKNVTNHYVKLLDNVNRELNSETAVNHRKFIEERYYLNKEELRLAEKALNKFQNEHNAIALENQTSAAIDIAAAIKSTLMTNQVKIEIMQQTLPEDHPDLANLQKENRLLQEQLDQLNTGKESDFLLPKFDQMSDLGMEYVRLSRDVEVQNQIFIFLTQQYEEAKISEAKDTPTLQVLDFGDIPEKKYKPARGRICYCCIYTYPNRITLLLLR